MKLNQIIEGDCLEVMKEMEANSVDTIITDPPYGLEFMGKKWDYDVPSVHFWQKALASCKPGATALVFAGSRTYHRMAVNMEDAGWELKDTIMWLYGSGFPKATDISKQLDKKAGKKGNVIGEKKHARKGVAVAEERTAIGGGAFGEERVEQIREPATPEAKLWNGWKSHGLKPAYEPIIVAMKPNDGSYANNALEHGVAGLNIDGSRVPSRQGEYDVRHYTKEDCFQNKTPKKSKFQVKPQPKGRFPANIILDEEAGKMLDEQSGESKSAGDYKNIKTAKQGGGIFGGGEVQNKYANQTGGASRFFYVAKASKSERNLGCEGFPIREKDTRTDTGKGSMTERGQQPMQNFHPTVKPLKLMEYLCTLTKTPTGGIVLDPFAGSGTTLMAAIKTGRDYIGIEKEKEYVKIAQARIKKVQTPLL